MRDKNAKYSLRWIAKRLNLKSHAHLARIAKGEKSPTDDLIALISSMSELTVDEFYYVKALAALKRARNEQERAYFLEKLEELRQDIPDVLVKLDHFELIARWYHLAIFELISLTNFKSDPKWISEQLLGDVSVETVIDSLARLERLGFIKKDQNGRWQRLALGFNTPTDIPSSTIRRFHEELLDKSKDMLDAIPVEERLFYSLTMPVDVKQIEEAKKIMIEFRTKFEAHLRSESPNAVYHLGMQFFPLSQRPKPGDEI